MRHNHRVALVAVLGTLVLGALGTASAQAAACKKTGHGVSFCIELAAIEETAVPFTTTTKAGTTAHFDWSHITWECGDTGNGNFTLTTGYGNIKVSNYARNFTKCENVTYQCEIREHAYPFEQARGEVSVSGGVSQLSTFFTYGPLGYVAKVHLENKLPGNCADPQELEVTTNSEKYAGPVCTIAEPEVEEVAHEIKCEGAQTRLVASRAPFELQVTESVSLSGSYSGKKWSFKES